MIWCWTGPQRTLCVSASPPAYDSTERGRTHAVNATRLHPARTRTARLGAVGDRTPSSARPVPRIRPVRACQRCRPLPALYYALRSACPSSSPHTAFAVGAGTHPGASHRATVLPLGTRQPHAAPAYRLAPGRADACYGGAGADSRPAAGGAPRHLGPDRSRARRRAPVPGPHCPCAPARALAVSRTAIDRGRPDGGVWCMNRSRRNRERVETSTSAYVSRP